MSETDWWLASDFLSNVLPKILSVSDIQKYVMVSYLLICLERNSTADVLHNGSVFIVTVVLE